MARRERLLVAALAVLTLTGSLAAAVAGEAVRLSAPARWGTLASVGAVLAVLAVPAAAALAVARHHSTPRRR